MRIRLLILATLVINFPASSQLLKVMTYNIRYDNPGDGGNAWSNRKHHVIELLNRSQPDILGVQEALFNQLEDLVRNLDGYAYVGVGRDDGKRKGEYSAILYRKDEFEVRDHNTFWLSETPDKPGSKSWDAAITRVATWARLYSKMAQTEIVVINTHFDHIGKEARIRSAELIRKKIPEIAGDLPVLLTGDLNFKRQEPPYQALMRTGGYPLIDAAPDDPPGTFCGFEVGKIECVPIDYIFYSSHWRLIDYNVLKVSNMRYYPSDHLPVLANIRLSQR